MSSGTTEPEACSGVCYFNIYTADLGNCGGCLPLTCFPCLTTSQLIYADLAMTQVVANGWYANEIEPEIEFAFKIIYFNCLTIISFSSFFKYNRF